MAVNGEATRTEPGSDPNELQSDRPDVSDHLKGEEQLDEERRILEEMLEVVEQRDALVALLEEQRLLDRQQDQNLEVLLAGALSWA